MGITITGEVIDVLQEESGQGKNGTWRKQQFVVEVPGQYPKQVAIIQWGDNIDKFGVTKGETLTAHVDIQSREYNGRWYTDVKAWKVSRDQSGGGASPGPDAEPWPEPPSDVDDEDDGLPF
ncbi:MAG: DUF3127 domain-containing protein [Gemmatimonadota bacterium]|nr:DUF3127 domain-containing protein [Gemmatimonadota bacterium]